MEVTQAERAAVTAVTPPAERAALALNSTQTERDLRELAVKHSSIQSIKDKAGRDQAHGAAMEVKRARTTIERIAREARDDATKFSKAVIAEQVRLVAIIEPEERRLLTLRDDWDAEEARIKEEKVAAERARIEQLRQRIEAIAHFERMALNCRTSAAVERLQGRLASVDLADMQDFEAEALQLHARITQRLVEIRAQRQTDEAERARVKAEQEAEAARLAAERANLEAARAEFEQRQKAHEERERAEKAVAQAAAVQSAVNAMAAHQSIEDLSADPESAESADPALAEPVPIEELEVAVPSAVQLIYAVAETFGVSVRDAQDWLIQRAAEIEVVEL